MSRLLVCGVVAAFAIGAVAFAQVVPPTGAVPKEYQQMVNAMMAAQAQAVRPGDEALECPALEREFKALAATGGMPAAPAGARPIAPSGAVQPTVTPQQMRAAQLAAQQAQAAMSQQIVTPQQAQALAAQGLTPQQIQAMQAAQAATARQLATPQAQAALQAQMLAAQQAVASPEVQAAVRAQAAALSDTKIQAALQAQAQALATPQAQAVFRAQAAQVGQVQDPAAQLAMTNSVMPQVIRSQRLMGLAMAKKCAWSPGVNPVVPPITPAPSRR